MKQVYLLIGVPGSGKTWVSDRLGDSYEKVLNDDFIGKDYVKAILEKLEDADKPVLAEAPFSISQIKEPLEKAGAKVIPVIILEDEKILSDRYQKRDGKPIPKGHLTRMNTYRERAKEYKAFSGTSQEVLKYLQDQVAGPKTGYVDWPGNGR